MLPEMVRLIMRYLTGSGMAESIIRQAAEDGIDTLVTCDNGIAALKEISIAKQLGMTVVVTDHHEVPVDAYGQILPPADAVVDPKQDGETYPYHEICGAVVAWKLINVIYEDLGIPEHEWMELLEFAAIATVGDVMKLQDENRLIVKYGLKKIGSTKNTGLRMLVEKNNLDMNNLSAYHIGFVIGPCLNAGGRLKSAKVALRMLLEQDPDRVSGLADELKELNDVRKDMTAKGETEAIEQVERFYMSDKVLVVFLPECHESLAGIIAGRLREHFHKPSFVLTRAEEGVKGSGRSIDAFHMYDEMTKCKQLFTKYGGHKLAAGVSMPEENVEEFRRQLNKNSHLTEDDFEEKVLIDVPMPMSYASLEFVEELERLEPFGNGNPKPLFAQKQVTFLKGRLLGQNQNVGKYTVADEDGREFEMIYFGDIQAFHEYLDQKFGIQAVERLYQGRGREIVLSVAYYPDINEYRGNVSLQMVMKYYM